MLVRGIGHLGAHHHALCKHHLPHRFAQIGVLADHLGNNVAGAFQRLFHAVHTFFRIHKTTGECFKPFGGRLLRPQIQGERFQPLLARHGGLGAALRPVGQIQILQLAFVEGRFNASFEFIGELALLGDGSKNRLAARHQIAEIAQLFFDTPDLNLIEIAGGLLAIARDERHRAAIIQQFDDSHQTVHGNFEGLGDVQQQVRGENSLVNHNGNKGSLGQLVSAKCLRIIPRLVRVQLLDSSEGRPEPWRRVLSWGR